MYSTDGSNKGDVKMDQSEAGRSSVIRVHVSKKRARRLKVKVTEGFTYEYNQDQAKFDIEHNL